MSVAGRVRRIAAPAVWALGTYWGTSLLLCGAAVLTLTAILPVTALFGAVAAVRRALAAAGGVASPITEAALLKREVLPLRWFARWMAFEGWTMLALACGGTFVLMRLWILFLLGELGLRRALGARRRQLVRFLLIRAAGVGLAGVAVGVWFGPAVWSIMTGVMTDLPSGDAAVVARYAGLLISAAVLGAMVPAWRFARATPTALLAWT